VGEERKQKKSSRYIGVSWHKTNLSWEVHLIDPQTKRQLHIGCYASEEKTQPGRTTVRLCRRVDQVPSATSQARSSVRCLCQWARRGFYMNAPGGPRGVSHQSRGIH
jgi:hypothetical protein